MITMKKLMCLLLMFCSVLAYGQKLTVTGIVTDGKESLPGVSIIIKGKTGTGTVTDVNGKYSLPVQNGDVLSFSFVGYTTKDVAYTGQKEINVSLRESVTQLNEAVVVGYAKQKKATLTGSVAVVGGESIVKRSVASLSTALQGTMPGVTIQQTSGQPGSDGSSIKIRGIGSINSNTDPLVLVDGIEMDINQVDMNTVESVSVLKDAASASIYGSRASNGVILITTKRGKEGKINVSYNGYVTFQRPTNLPKPVSAADFLQAELNSWDNAGIAVTPEARTERLQLIQDQRDYAPDNWNRYDTDWKSATISDYALMHSHNASISGGTEKLTFYGSGTYLSQDGLIANNNYNRTNLRLNVDSRITSWAKFTVESSLRESKNIVPSITSPKSIINKALYMLPTLSAVRELDGNWGYGKNGDNPTAAAEAGGTITTKATEALVNGTLTLTPLKGMEIIGQYSKRIATNRKTQIVKPYTVSLKGTVMGIYPTLDNVDESWEQVVKNYYRTQISYTNKVGKHTGTILAGFQAEDNNNDSFGAGMRGFELDRWYLSNGDGSTATARGGASGWAMMSFFARLNYNYDEKYLLELTGRYDGSSRFAKDNRWGFFPSVSAGWVISRENFMESTQDVLDFLKVRASYGVLGNQNIGNYPYTALVESGYSYWFDKELSSGVAQIYLANQNISWEKSKQMNFGIDATLWGGKLGITADYYVKDVYDMLMRFPLPYFAGMKPAFTNAGDMRNKGWEIALSHKNTIGDFTYGVIFTLSDNQNEVTNLNGLTFQDKSIVEGYPKGGYWGYRTDGYYQDMDDVNNSPKLSSAARPGFVKYQKVATGEDENPMQIGINDQVYLGDPFPHYEYGITLNGSWKGLDLSLFLQGVGKRSVYMSGVGLKPFANGSNLFEHQLDSWTENNRNAAYPILVPEANSADNFQRSDKWVGDGSYLRLKNVVLGYTLPDQWVKRIGLGSTRIYASGQNLFTKSNFYKGYDPEVSYDGSVGGEFYPIMQTFTIGLDFKF